MLIVGNEILITFVVMEKRLPLLLRALNLSAAQFADKIGVQRSSVSHVISGRNKPSMDFTEKIVNHFPQINAEWLIIGTGSMMKGGDLFSAGTQDFREVKVKSNTSTEQGTEQPKDQIREKKSPEILTEKRNSGPEIARAERIVYFFSDGTFKEYLKARD